MLSIKTSDNIHGKIISISNSKDTLDIMFGGNGDLYFSPKMNRQELFDNDEHIFFEITDLDSEIYPIFLNLYNKITSYSPYDRDEDDTVFYEMDTSEEEFERLRDEERRFPLVNNGVISWHSDDADPIEDASVVNISKEDNKIILEFIKNHPKDELYITYSVRFRNSGSSYDPFNIRFMELYNKLCNIDFSYHQISIKEYLYQKEQKKESLGIKNGLLKTKQAISIEPASGIVHYTDKIIYGYTVFDGAYDDLYGNIYEDSINEELETDTYYLADVSTSDYDGDYHTYAETRYFDGLFLAIDLSIISLEEALSKKEELIKLVNNIVERSYGPNDYKKYRVTLEDNKCHDNINYRGVPYLAISMFYRRITPDMINLSNNISSSIRKYLGDYDSIEPENKVKIKNNKNVKK